MPYSSKRERNRQRAAKNNNNSSSRKGRRDPKGRNRDCVLTEMHLNVTDLGLGYNTKEELIFRYCSGSCESAVTVYDQILNNLTQNRKLASDKIRPQPCCRPIAYDDDVSFLDDDLSTYHILKKHSAKRCGCVWHPFWVWYCIPAKEGSKALKKMEWWLQRKARGPSIWENNNKKKTGYKSI